MQLLLYFKNWCIRSFKALERCCGYINMPQYMTENNFDNGNNVDFHCWIDRHNCELLARYCEGCKLKQVLKSSNLEAYEVWYFRYKKFDDDGDQAKEELPVNIWLSFFYKDLCLFLLKFLHGKHNMLMEPWTGWFATAKIRQLCCPQKLKFGV